MQQLIVSTPLGPYRVSATPKGITEIDPVESVAMQPPHRDGATVGSDAACTRHLDLAARWLQAYFAGQRPGPKTLELDLVGTPFQLAVWDRLRRIPYGETRTYADIARALGRGRGSARAIGGANGRNPISIVVPCHRVIAAGGKLGGYGGGLDRKRYLLRLEGAALL